MRRRSEACTRPCALARAGAVLAGAIALLGLSGWMFDAPILRSVLAGAVEMKANTAFGLSAAALALFILAGGTRAPALRRGAQALALAVLLLGLVTLGEYLLGWRLALDELVLRDTGAAYNAIRGRMSPHSAFAFMAIGTALTCLPYRGARPLALATSLACATIGAITLAGYVWNASELVTDSVFPPVALNTASAFLLLGGGAMLADAAAHPGAGVRSPHVASIERKLIASFAVTLLLVLLGGSYTYRLNVQLAGVVRSVVRIQQLRSELAELRASVIGAVSAERGFLLTGDETWRSETNRELALTARRQAAIGGLLAEEPTQRAEFDELRRLVDERMAVIAQVLERFEREGVRAAGSLIATGRGDRTSERIRELSERMDAALAQLVAERQSEAARTREVTLLSLLATLAISVVVLVGLFSAIRREMMLRAEADELEAAQRRALLQFAGTSSREQTLEGFLRLLAESPAFGALRFYGDGPTPGELHCECALPAQARAAPPLRAGEGLAGRAALAQSLLVGAASECDLPLIPGASDGLDSVMACAVRYGEDRLGVLVVGARRPPGARERTFVELMARQLALALHNQEQYGRLVRLSEQLRLKNEEIERQNAQLENASRLKSEFLATMSHELRTPLNAIIGFSEVLRDGLVGELTPQQREHVGDVLASGEHLLALINDILDISKIEAGRMELHAQMVDVRTILENALHMVREKALDRRIALKLDIAPEVTRASLDARKLKQILYNLLSNAVKFTPDHGSVTLACSMAGPAELQLSVSDTGVGIAPLDQARLFEPFFQVDSSLARNHEGTGLGLAMVRRLVELHGGEVTLASEQGVGSTFTVRLPLGPAQAGEDMRAVPRRVPRVGRPLALVVEDEDSAAELLCIQLEGEGMETLRASGGEAALRLARERLPDLITLDVRMPGLDGWDTLAALKAEAVTAAIPVVVVSIVAGRRRGLALGAAYVLQKPVERRELRAGLLELGLLPASTHGKVTILVVDDDPKSVEIIGAFLRAEGCDVVEAYGGREAIERAQGMRPDLVILDLMMPEVSGFDVVEALKRSGDTHDIPIIILTGRMISDEDRALLEHNVVRLLEKSEFSRDAFIAEVHRALDRRRAPETAAAPN